MQYGTLRSKPAGRLVDADYSMVESPREVPVAAKVVRIERQGRVFKNGLANSSEKRSA